MPPVRVPVLRYAVLLAVASQTTALRVPHRPLAAPKAHLGRPLMRAAALVPTLVPSLALADPSVLAEQGVGAWFSSLGQQDYVALAVLAFLVVFVIPSLVSDMLETQADPAAAMAKKQQRLKDLSEKYSFVPGSAPEPAPDATPEDLAKAEKLADKNTAEDAAADELIASVKALTDKP